MYSRNIQGIGKKTRPYFKIYNSCIRRRRKVLLLNETIYHNYTERHLNLHTLKYRRFLRSNMIELFKITHNIYDIQATPALEFNNRGDRSFATAGPRIWNTLPRDVTTATSLLSFRRKLKTHLFRQSYPDIVV